MVTRREVADLAGLKTRHKTRCHCPEVLVVDDDSFNIMAVESILHSINLTNHRAFNGQEAVQKALRGLELGLAGFVKVPARAKADIMEWRRRLSLRVAVILISGDWKMSKKELYVERREDGNYAIRRPGSERASDVRDTQAKAIDRARDIDRDAAIHVERVRNTDRGSRDKWRKP